MIDNTAASEPLERMPVQPGGDEDTCPRCGIYRKHAGYLEASCGEENFKQPGCFVEGDG